MLLIFIIGFVVGIIISYIFYMYKKDVSLDVKSRIQQEEIKRQKEDNEMLENLNKKLYSEIDKLKKELYELKNK